MKRKIRIFSHIAIIALSVCMFAFGVYAANTASVTTSGTVTFNATDVYARVTRTIENVDATSKYNAIDITYDAGTADNHNDKFENETLKFESADNDVAMRFTIQNLATEEGRYVYATFTEIETESTNVTKLASALGGEIAIAPTESKEIVVYMRVTDPNLSANAGYNYTLTLKNTTTGVVLNDTLATFTAITDTDGNTTGYSIDGLKTTTTASTVAQMNAVATADTIDPATLANIIIPEEYNGKPVTTIGASAFASNTVLTNVTIPDSVTSIGDNAFKSCSNLIVFNVSKDSLLESIGFKAFADCSKLKDFNFPKNFRTFGQQAFDSTGLVKVYLPEGLINTGVGSFNNCDSLVDVSLPSTVEVIGRQTFGYSALLKGIVFPENITEIGYSAFFECSSLEFVELPEKEQEVLLNYTCFALTGIKGEVYIPDNINMPYTSDFTNGPFCMANNLTSFRVNDTNTKFIAIDGILYQRKSSDPASSDYNVPLKLDIYPSGKTSETYTLPATITSIRRYELNNAANLAEIHVEEGNSKWSSVDGIMYNKAGTTISLVPNKYNKTIINLSPTLTAIGVGALGNSVKELYIPSTLTSIAQNGFGDCKVLTKVGLLGQEVEEGTFDFSGVTNLTKFLYKTFKYCEGMKTLKVGANFTTFGETCFQYAINLEAIYIYNESAVVNAEYIEGSYAPTPEENFRYLTKLSAIYVPDDLVDDYKDSETYPCWAPVADKIKPLSEAPNN